MQGGKVTTNPECDSDLGVLQNGDQDEAVDNEALFSVEGRSCGSSGSVVLGDYGTKLQTRNDLTEVEDPFGIPFSEQFSGTACAANESVVNELTFLHTGEVTDIPPLHHHTNPGLFSLSPQKEDSFDHDYLLEVEEELTTENTMQFQKSISLLPGETLCPHGNQPPETEETHSLNGGSNLSNTQADDDDVDQHCIEDADMDATSGPPANISINLSMNHPLDDYEVPSTGGPLPDDEI